MIEGLFNVAGYSGVKSMLDATVMRHEAIASNLANVETPNYKRVDVSPAFEAELKQAYLNKDGARINSLRPTLSVDQTAVTRGRDGNSVQLEEELSLMQKNTVEHALESQMITGYLMKLRMAITGRS